MFNCISSVFLKYTINTSRAYCLASINRRDYNIESDRRFSNRSYNYSVDILPTNRLLSSRDVLHEQRRYEFVGFGKDFGRRFDKYDKEDGKREIDPEVPLRFYRLTWGPWIRTYGARHIDLWKKRSSLRSKYKKHIFCNAHQSHLLDKMTTKVWTTRKYYPDDFYEPYHQREEYLDSRRKPLPATVLEPRIGISSE